MSALPFMDNIGTASFRRVRTVAVNQSPFNGQVYRSGMMDTRWQFRFDYQLMTRRQAQPLLAAIAAQGEGVNGFIVYDPDFGVPLSGIGALGLTIAGPAGTTLSSGSWPASTLIAKAGDRVGVLLPGGWRIFVSLTDVVSNGAGAATFSFDAPLPAVASGNTIQLNFAQAEFGLTARLLSYDVQTQPGGLFSISVQGEEVL